MHGTTLSLGGMHTRVTAILVARSGAAYLERTLNGLTHQSRQPDSLVAVDAGSGDAGDTFLAASGPIQLVTTGESITFGSAVTRALSVTIAAPLEDRHSAGSAPDDAADEWFWLLAHDNAPHPDALATLLAAVEIAPSVGIAGPKLMRWDEPGVIAEFGESMTTFGASFAMVEGELDQAQHDVQSDVLAVAAAGMLVRRSLWTALGGFDPALPSVDAALDFCIRARLAGFRVIGVPGAKVSTAGGPELFGRRSISDRRRARLKRSAQLHRRLTYAPGILLPLHWLTLLPVAILRSIGQLLAKRPGAVGGELSAALSAAFGGSHIGAARRNLRRTSKTGWASIARLRMPAAQVRERRLNTRDTTRANEAFHSNETRAGFVSHGGLAVVAFTAVVGLIAWGPVLRWTSIAGGSLLPLSENIGQLWAHVGYGSREIGTGFVGAADPFAYVLAVLGSITFWSPSSSVTLLYILALPLSALGAWFAARRLSKAVMLPSLAALLWSIAPPLLGSLSGGNLGAVIAHLLLPWLVLTVLSAPRSWTASAAAALLFAGVGASAPILIPALVLALLAWIVARPRSVLRLGGILIPIAALFAPLVVQQVQRGNIFGLLAEPGVPVARIISSSLHLVLLSPTAGLNGWTGLLKPFSFADSVPTIVVAVLLAPVAILALLALFVPGSRRAIPAMIIAFLGFASAVAAAHIQVASVGAASAAIWPDAALSLFWLGLVGASLVALDALGRASISIGLVTAVTASLLAVPLLGALDTSTASIVAGQRALPAVVDAEASARPQIGTLVLSAQSGVGTQSDGTLAATIERGAGATLDDQSTLAATSTSLTRTESRVAVLAGNLASRSGLDASSELANLAVGFVLLTPEPKADAAAKAVFERTSQALDSNALFTPVGDTGRGILWRYSALSDSRAPTIVANTATPVGLAILIGQAIIFGATVLLGIPTTRRRRRVALSGAAPGEPANTFDGESNDD